MRSEWLITVQRSMKKKKITIAWRGSRSSHPINSLAQPVHLYGEEGNSVQVLVSKAVKLRDSSNATLNLGRGDAVRAEISQGTPAQSHVSPSILVYEDTKLVTGLKFCVLMVVTLSWQQ